MATKRNKKISVNKNFIPLVVSAVSIFILGTYFGMSLKSNTQYPDEANASTYRNRKPDFNYYCPKVVTGTKSITITDPADGSVVEKGSVVKISVTTSDEVPITRFFVDDAFWGQYLGSNYQSAGYFQVPNKPNTTYELKAMIYETNNANDGCIVDSIKITSSR